MVAGLSSSSNNSSVAEEPGCYYTYEVQRFNEIKLYIVGIGGTFVSLISISQNSILSYLFVTQRRLRTNHQFYMSFLAMCDVFISFSYICLMSVFVVAESVQFLPLFRLWHAYLRPMFTVSHVAMAVSSFLIMAATIERYVASIDRFQSVRLLRDHRPKIATIAILLGILTRGSIYFEIVIVNHDGCEGFAAMSAWPSPLAQQPLYATVWMFFFRNVTTVFLPFAVLAFCNASIVISLHRQHHRSMRVLLLQAAVGRANIDAARARIRSATQMLLIVVTCYLISNALNVFITVWEHIDKADLVGNHYTFYTISSDIVSLLTICACALRLPIYCAFNEQIRQEVLGVLARLWQCCFAEIKAHHVHACLDDGQAQVAPVELLLAAECEPLVDRRRNGGGLGAPEAMPAGSDFAYTGAALPGVWSWQLTV